MAKTQTIVVGAGIAGTLIANELAKKYNPNTIRVIDRDPRHSLSINAKYEGTTFKGGNVRQISAREATAIGLIPSASKLLRTSTQKGGWLALPNLSSREKKWRKEFDETASNPKQLRKNQRTILEMNVMGLKGWHKIAKEWPEVFEGMDVDHDVPMFYSDSRELKSDFQEEMDYNLRPKMLAEKEILRKYPSILGAMERGDIVGAYAGPSGAVHVKTLVVNMQRDLKKRGVTFTHEMPVVGISRTNNGSVCGLITKNGKHFVADNYILSPGVPSHDLLKGSKTDGKIMAMAGIWFRLVNKVGIHKAFKTNMEHMNVTPAPDGSVYFSGMYAFVGEQTAHINMPGLKHTFGHFWEIIAKLFPEIKKNMELERRVCVRPMTPNQVSLLERNVTTSGGSLVIAAGNGAAGFTQAPVMAQAVSDIIANKKSKARTLFEICTV
ncbi:MAG: FAD-dependent oxidoreductase [bacterium]|nr:FAD-dependent oxidoreductase [bacterium]